MRPVLQTITYTLTLAAVLLHSSCSKYDPIYGVVGNEVQGTAELRKNFVYIYDNEVYLCNQILSNQTKLTNNSNSSNSPFTTKTHVALSPNIDKIAYLDAYGTPVIIDTDGNQLDRLTQYSNVKDIGWHFNNGNPTLFLLVNNTIAFWGQSLDLVNNPFDYVLPATALFYEIDALDINENLDITFSYRYYEPNSASSLYRRYYYGVGVQYNDNSTPDTYLEIYDNFYYSVTDLYSNQLYNLYHMVRFNNSNGSVDLAQTIHQYESNNDFQWIRNYQPYATSATNVNTINSACYYKAGDQGEVAANVYQIEKHFVELPEGVSPPTGTPNTFVINLGNANNSLPTYFDWQP